MTDWWMHSLREASARVAWIAGTVTAFVVVRVTFIGFERAGPWPDDHCPISARSFFTVWRSDHYCMSQPTRWLMAGRIGVVLAVVATLLWRYAYQRDRTPDW